MRVWYAVLCWICICGLEMCLCAPVCEFCTQELARLIPGDIGSQVELTLQREEKSFRCWSSSANSFSPIVYAICRTHCVADFLMRFLSVFDFDYNIQGSTIYLNMFPSFSLLCV